MLLLQLYAHKIATNPTQEIMTSLFVILTIDKSSLKSRTIRIIRSILNSGFRGEISGEVLAKVRSVNDKEVQEVLAEVIR